MKSCHLRSQLHPRETLNVYMAPLKWPPFVALWHLILASIKTCASFSAAKILTQKYEEYKRLSLQWAYHQTVYYKLHQKQFLAERREKLHQTEFVILPQPDDKNLAGMVNFSKVISQVAPSHGTFISPSLESFSFHCFRAVISVLIYINCLIMQIEQQQQQQQQLIRNC